MTKTPVIGAAPLALAAPPRLATAGAARLAVLAPALALVATSACLVAAGAPFGRVAVLLVIAPLLEEAVFRAGLQEALLRQLRRPLAANLVTALVFGVAHAALRGEPAAFAVALPAVLIGAIYARTRRLAPCALLHAALNAAWLGWNLF